MIDLDNLTAEEIVVLTNAIAVELSRGKTVNEINVVGNIIETVGCIMLTIAAQKQNLESLKESSNDENNSKTKK